jgi:hypothetical protein
MCRKKPKKNQKANFLKKARQDLKRQNQIKNRKTAREKSKCQTTSKNAKFPKFA